MTLATEKGFDFDSPEYSYKKQPACKAIPMPVAGLWIAHENQELASWTKDRLLEQALAHKVRTSQYDENGLPIEIPGALFRQPRLLVIGRSPLLAGIKRKVQKIWEKGDKDAGFQSARRYLLIFLDSANQPLHVVPIQLTAWSVFQLEFDRNLMAFRTALEGAYALGTGKPKQSKTPLWHSMGIFCPQFKTEVRGQTKETSSPCCVTTGFAMPSVQNWEQFCVGRTALAPEIAALHNSMSDWWHKGIKQVLSTSVSDEQQFEEDFDDTEFSQPIQPQGLYPQNSAIVKDLLTTLSFPQKRFDDWFQRSFNKAVDSLTREEMRKLITAVCKAYAREHDNEFAEKAIEPGILKHWDAGSPLKMVLANWIKHYYWSGDEIGD
jgi:hypothetical protein